MDKVPLLEAVATRWNVEGLRYSVSHGLEGYPDSVGRDLDVLTRRRDARRAIDLAEDVLESRGLIVARPPAIWGERLVAATLDSEPDLLEVHAVDELAWRFCRVATNPEPSMTTGPFAIDPWVTFAKRILIPALAQHTGKLLSELQRHPIGPAEREAAAQRLAEFAGEMQGSAFLRAIVNRSLRELDEVAPALRRSVMRRGWSKSAFAPFRWPVKVAFRRISQLYSPCAPVICITTSAANESSAISDAILDDRLIFTNVTRHRWAVSRAPASNNGQHWYRLARYIALNLKRSVADQLRSSRQQLTVYDGCALDLVTNPTRFGLRSSAGAVLCWNLVPKPDVVILLQSADASPRADTRLVSPLTGESRESKRQDAFAGIREVVALPADAPLSNLQAAARRIIVSAFLKKNRALVPPRNPAYGPGQAI